MLACGTKRKVPIPSSIGIFSASNSNAADCCCAIGGVSSLRDRIVSSASLSIK